MSKGTLKEKRFAVLFWSIAFPGFGQLINKKYVKAFIFIILEVIINVKGNINGIIVESFLWNTEHAVEQANYTWLMFYPCIYLFGIWDAYYDAGGKEVSFSFIPYVISAYCSTLGVVYSSSIIINGFLIGPIFLPIITIVLGFIIGEMVRRVVINQIQPDV